MHSTRITAITIHETRCEWGEPVTDEQDAALHDRYETAVMAALTAAYPGVEIEHTIDRRMGSGPGRIAITRDAVDGSAESDRECESVRALLGSAWQSTLEGAADIFRDFVARNPAEYCERCLACRIDEALSTEAGS